MLFPRNLSSSSQRLRPLPEHESAIHGKDCFKQVSTTERRESKMHSLRIVHCLPEKVALEPVNALDCHRQLVDDRVEQAQNNEAVSVEG